MSWPQATLDELCEVSIGRTPSRTEPRYWSGGVFPWVSIADMTGQRDLLQTKEGITKAAIHEAKMKIVPKGTVLMSFKLSLGKVSIAQTDLFTNEAIAALPVKDPTKLDAGYLARALEAINFDEEGNRAAMGRTLNKKSVALLKIPLPPLEEQKRIAAILDQADALRSLRARTLDKLNTLGQAIFHEMFGDDLRSENRNKLGDLIEVRSSLDDPKLPENASLPHVGPEHIFSGSGAVDWTRVRTCAEDAVTSGKYVFQAGDVLYSKIRPYLNKVAMADRKGMCSADMYALYVPNGSISSRFLHFVLGSRDFLSYAETVSNRANIPKMNRKQLLEYTTAVPSRAAQNQFEIKLAGLDLQTDQFILAQEAAGQLFSSLQHRAFRGEL